MKVYKYQNFAILLGRYDDDGDYRMPYNDGYDDYDNNRASALRLADERMNNDTSTTNNAKYDKIKARAKAKARYFYNLRHSK